MLNVGGAITCTWNTQQTTTFITVSPTVTTIYTATGTLNNGCPFKLTYTVQINAVNLLISSSAAVLCLGQTATLSASGAELIFWQNPIYTGSQVVINPIVTTNYTVIGKNSSGCIDFAIYTQSVSICTNISNDNPAQQKIKLFPNPNNGSFAIDGLNQIEGFRIRLFNLMGKTVIDELFLHNELKTDLPSGVYYFQLYKDRLVLTEGKFVVDKAVH